MLGRLGRVAVLGSVLPWAEACRAVTASADARGGSVC